MEPRMAANAREYGGEELEISGYSWPLAVKKTALKVSLPTLGLVASV